jgi:hypothetical protein
MNIRKLQLLISAGVFSATLLSGAAYGEDKAAADTNQVQVSCDTAKTADVTDQAATTAAKKKTSNKSGADMGCSSANGCGNH